MSQKIDDDCTIRLPPTKRKIIDANSLGGLHGGDLVELDQP